MSAKSRTSKHFQPGAWYRHKKGERHYYQHGVAFLSCRMQGGAHAFTVHWRWYLRERTVRRVNRTRPPEKRLKFRSKGSLARIMLQELHTLLAPEITSSVQFASWYAAATWIQCCRRHGWHVSCALKSHRKFNGKPLYSIAPRYLRQRKAPEVTITYSTTLGT